jgi:hypothetical protein
VQDVGPIEVAQLDKIVARAVAAVGFEELRAAQLERRRAVDGRDGHPPLLAILRGQHMPQLPNLALVAHPDETVFDSAGELMVVGHS